MKYLETSPIEKMYPETARHFGLSGIYHHFIGDHGETVSYPLKSEGFKTLEICEVEYARHNKGGQK